MTSNIIKLPYPIATTPPTPAVPVESNFLVYAATLAENCPLPPFQAL